MCIRRQQVKNQKARLRGDYQLDTVTLWIWKGDTHSSICQQNKIENIHPAGLLQPLPIPEQKWESVSMDFTTGVPKVQGRDCLYVVVDRLTKFAHFFSISFDYSAAQVAELFFREFLKLHQLPKTIVSDRDSRFTGALW